MYRKKECEWLIKLSITGHLIREMQMKTTMRSYFILRMKKLKKSKVSGRWENGLSHPLWKQTLWREN